ncbi:hybrid sensor histidine kinase/response regulator [Geopsychrobacter electrodiphilus]|uniref:hybrid sensor histidine kinase/response regulator n=1 Tax=Geopsychrobacter electrodiphilus TaxID=225196 RepID=UPI000373693A|nr:PAS domain-containing sensor histidine kinase [Geopsychrobacter electrodiphilus]
MTLDAHALARILLLQNMISQLEDQDSVFSFVCRGLEEIPGVEKAAYSSDRKKILPTNEARHFPIQLNHSHYGEICLFLSSNEAFQPYHSFISNLCFMIAVILEERHQSRLNQQHQQLLERQIEIRTKELKEKIRERRMAEERALKAQKSAELYLDISEAMILELDRKGKIRLINKRGCQILGYEQADLLGQDWFKLCIPSPVLPAVQKVFAEAMAGQKDFVEYAENEIICQAGELRFISWHNVLQRNEKGQIVCVLCSGIDITERKRAENALRQSEATFRKLFEDSSDAILLIDDTGVFVECNQAALDLLKMTREQFLFSPPERISPEFQPDGRRSDEAAAKMVALAYSKGMHRFDWSHINAEGSVFTVEVSLMPITIKGQTMLHTSWRDITERKRAEEEKIKLESQLQQTRKIESIGQLAGGVAHDFNNMLGVILGHVELAMMRADPSHRLFHHLEEISKAAKHSADLTRQLLTFARKQAVVPKVLDLNETVAGMLQILQRLIGENIQLSWHPAASLWPVKVDPSQIDQILANLAVNARDAISGVGKISITTGNSSIDKTFCVSYPDVVPGDYVQLSFSDDGKGMEKEVQAHIFEPFFTTKVVGEGTGLGLATVYGAVRQNNGFITLYSEPGHGTIFNIYLPRTQTVLEAVQKPAAKLLRRGKETILLVEDDELLLHLETEILEGSGYTVLPAALPSVALSLAERHPGPIPLLISDVIMPEMNGKELTKQLQALRPGMKVLFMSGYTADIISQQGFIEEGVFFLQKPVSLETLIDKVQEVLVGS